MNENERLEVESYLEEFQKAHQENLESCEGPINSFYLKRYCHVELQEKKRKVVKIFKELMEVLGVDKDYYKDSIEGTPERVAKMFLEETFKGMIGNNYPKIMRQENHFNYREMVLESGIEINSVCEHHFVPILGKAHIAYIPDKYLLGLSKLNRLADFHSRRPQVQERLTTEIAEDLAIHVGGERNVAVCVDALHCCVKMRGIQDSNCVTRTYHLMGKFKDEKVREEFFCSIPDLKDFKI